MLAQGIAEEKAASSVPGRINIVSLFFYSHFSTVF
jgi:hypothetical protein